MDPKGTSSATVDAMYDEAVYISESLFDTVSEQSEHEDEQEPENEPERMAREMLDIPLETVTSGKYKRKQETREICSQKIEELMSRVWKKSRILGDHMSESSSKSEFGVAEETIRESDKVEEILANPLILESIILGQLPSVREIIVEDRSNIRQETRKQRVKHCIKLKEEAAYLHVKNLLLQRKINHINMSRKGSERKRPVEEGIRETSKRLALRKEYRDSLLEYGELKESFTTAKERLEVDLAKRRKREYILQCALRSEQESLRSFWVSELTKLRSLTTGKMVSPAEAEEMLKPVKERFNLLHDEHLKYCMSLIKSTAMKRRVTSLEIFGKGANINEYEQLEEHCRKMTDLIEERKDELKELHQRATSDIQAAAHMKDFMDGLEGDTEEALENLENVDDTLKRIRTQVMNLKKTRDNIRRDTKEILHQVGLLEFPDLIEDFKSVRERRKEAEEKLDHLVALDSQQEANIERTWLLLVKLGFKYRVEMPELFPILENFLRRNTTFPSLSKSLLVISKTKRSI